MPRERPGALDLGTRHRLRLDGLESGACLSASPVSRPVSQKVFDALEESVVILFLSTGPVLGAAIFLTWFIGLVLGFVAVLTR